jgi:hypothetical protein
MQCVHHKLQIPEPEGTYRVVLRERADFMAYMQRCIRRRAQHLEAWTKEYRRVCCFPLCIL